MTTLLIEDRDSVRTITMNRPERRNALNPTMQDELIEALAAAPAAGALVVVIAGAGEAFCSGLDLSVLAGSNDRSAEDFRVEAARTASMFAAIWKCELPTIAKVHGPAMAGGAGVAMLCDMTIASTTAVFGFPEVKIGFVPALVGAYLPLLIGEKRAVEMLLSGRRYTASEALLFGLVNEVVEAEQLDARAAAITAELLANSPQAVAATRRMLRAQLEDRLAPALKRAAEVNAAARETEDFREGVASFLEKRKPRWTVSKSA
ncbi:MAG: enoyl-CoA hydratase-related protein [Bryocella sp.]